MAAEAYAISETAETAELARMVLTEIFFGDTPLRQLEAKSCQFMDIYVRTDSDSLDRSVQRECGSVADKRLYIVIAALRECFRKTRRQ